MHTIQDGNPTAVAPISGAAIRMAIMASLSNNIVIATTFGTFGVLVQDVQDRLHATPEMAFAGMTILICGAAVFASVAGFLAKRVPLRILGAAGAALAALGLFTLALVNSYPVYLMVYGLLLAPAMALNGMVLPATLIARWFPGRIGLVLGLVYLPVLTIVMPLAANHVLGAYGIEALYLILGALCAAFILPSLLLIRDHPPEYRAAAPAAAHGSSAVAAKHSLATLLTDPRFILLALLYSISTSGSNIMSAHIVQMAQHWHIARGDAALLASIIPLVGSAGSIVFGWLADKIGGVKALGLIACNTAILWLLLLAQPSFAMLGATTGLIGLHCAGGMPATSRAVADTFGPEEFSSVFGMCSSASIPIAALSVFFAASVSQHFGTYVPVLIALSAMGFAGALCALLFGGALRRVAATA